MPNSIYNQRRVYSYAHRGDGDIMEMASSQNLPGVRKREVGMTSRAATPVVARDRAVFQQLHERRVALSQEHRSGMRPSENNIAKLRGFLARIDHELHHEKPDVETAQVLERQAQQIEQTILGDTAVRDRWRRQAEAVEATPILGPEHLSGLPSDAKLLVLGHGTAGVNRLSTTESKADAFALRDVAQGLRAAGLSRDFSNFALTSCHSADAEEHTEFVQDPPAQTPGGTAPAQSLANELQRAGFTQPKVKGYQGAGLREPYGLSAERVSADGSEIARRKDTRKEFFPASERQWWMR